MANVFLSYKREKRERVRLIAEALGRSGLSVYWDTRLRASADYIQKLNAELLSADCVVVAWCRESIGSAWVMAECIKAHRRGNLLPIKIEEVDEDLVPAPFNIIQSLDLVGWNGNVDDPRWLTLKDDIKDLISRRGGLKIVEINEDEDAVAMSTEVFSQVAAGGNGTVVTEPDSAAFDLGPVKSFIQQLVDKSGGSVAHAAVAHALIAKWPDKTGRYNWFGHKRFAQLFKALHFRDLRLDTSGAGTITRIQGSEASTTGVGTGPNVVVLPVATGASQESSTADDSLRQFADRVFAITGAPNLSPPTYQALIKAIALAIQSGAKTLSDISRQARDALDRDSTPVGRVRTSFVTKGALIGGLNLEHRPMRPAMVAMFYANSLIALCKANGLELSSLEQDRLLELIGFSDL